MRRRKGGRRGGTYKEQHKKKYKEITEGIKEENE